MITADTLFSGKSAELAALASRHAMPTISQYREFVTAGGLMSYGGNVTELYRLVASTPAACSRARSRLICRYSRSRNLSSLSTSRPRKHSASTCLPSLLARADEVIE